MKLSLSLTSIIFVAVVTLNGCSKDEKQVNDANAATPVKQDESPPIGVWVSGEGDRKELVVTNEKFDECKWLIKPPKEGNNIEGCVNYYTNTMVSKKILENELNQDVKETTKIFKAGEHFFYGKLSPSEIEEKILELKKKQIDVQALINRIADGDYRKIAFDSEDDSGDCNYSYYFSDNINLYQIVHCNNNIGLIDFYIRQKKIK